MAVRVRDESGKEWRLEASGWYLDNGHLHVGDNITEQTAAGPRSGFRAIATFAPKNWANVRAEQAGDTTT